MFIDISKLDRNQVRDVLEAAGWAWDEARSIAGEENRRDCERLVNEAYVRGFRAALKSRVQIDAIVAAWAAEDEEERQMADYEKQMMQAP